MGRCAVRFCLSVVWCTALLLGDTGASDVIDKTLAQLEQVRTFRDVAISPDGQWLSWTVESSGGTPSFHLEPRRPGARAEAPFALPEQATAAGRAVWSPDSKRFALLVSLASSSQLRICLATPGAAAARLLPELRGYLTGLAWSPDGRQLAVLYAEGGGGAGPLEAVPAQTGSIGAELHNQRISLVDLDSGQTRPVSPASLNVYEYAWSPDGTQFLATAAPGPADNNWWIARLYAIRKEDGKPTELYHPPADQQLAVPRWSPDGKTVAFIGGLMSDQGFTGGDLFLLPASAGATPRNLTARRERSPNWFRWLSPDSLLFTESVGGGSAISTITIATGQSETLWQGPEGVHDAGNYPNFALADDGRTAALVRSNWQTPPEVWSGSVGEWQQVSHENGSQQPRWGKTESVSWTSDGFHIQGWLVYPLNYNPQRRYPMVVEVHGGPAGSRTAQWPTTHFDMSVLAGLDYFVFFPNPRGSYGQGEAFTRANVKDFGGGDLRDILAGVDTVLAKVPVDPGRLGLTGWSYGGFMTMFAVTQTNRFHAAVAGAGIANWQSYYGENSIDQWMIPYFGDSVYNAPDVYAKSSAISFIKQVKTPTLVVVGERDGECPAPQSFEFWHALHTLDVPTDLVVYAGEGHSFRDPQHRHDVMRRALTWFQDHLQPATPTTN